MTAMLLKPACRLCGEQKLEILIEFGNHPIAHRLLRTQSEPEYTHPVTVCLCAGCGLIQLIDPIPPEEMYTDYNWLSAWKWNPHVPRLVELINQLSEISSSSRILEVGSNDGSFLCELRGRGYQKLLGIEPARDAREAAKNKGIETIGDYFDTKTASKLSDQRGKFDLFVARQVLEHVTGLDEFARAIQVAVRPDGYVLIEVPNYDFFLTEYDYSGIWEEHSNYFTAQTLARFMASAGVQVLQTETAVFSGEALFMLGQFVGKNGALHAEFESKATIAKARAYRDQWPALRQRAIGYLSERRSKGKRTVVYGAGCRACSLINFAGLGPYIDIVVDDQREKQGKFMPGCRLPILPSEALLAQSVDLCLLAVNAENEEKVIDKHAAYLNRGGEFYSVHPPSPRLAPFWNGIHQT